MLTNILYFLTILLLIWILVSIFVQFIYPLKQFRNVLIAAYYIYAAALVTIFALKYPEFKLPVEPLLLFVLGSIISLVGVSLLTKRNSYPQQVRVWLKLPILFFMVGYLVNRSSYQHSLPWLLVALYFVLAFLLIKNRDRLRLPLRSFIFFTLFLVPLIWFDFLLLKFVSGVIALYYLYQFTNHFLIKYYFEQKIEYV